MPPSPVQSRLLRYGVTLACSLLAALAWWWPAFRRPQATGIGDFGAFHHAWEAGFVALSRHGEWPLWDPFHCGGITLLGDPQSQFFSPFFALAFVAGPTVGIKMFLVAHAALGFAGMFVFARREQQLGVLGALCASAAWAGSGFFSWHGVGGHSAFAPFYLTPLVLTCFRRAARDLRWAAAVALLIGLVLCGGGVYPFAYLVVLCAFDALARLAAPAERAGVVVAGLVAAPLAALVGAVRLLPIADTLSHKPRLMPSLDAVRPGEVLEMLTARAHGWDFAGHRYRWPEYGCFVGYGVLALAAVGLGVLLYRRRAYVPCGLLVFGALMLGDHGPWSPWALLHGLPVYGSLRVPSRFAVFFTFFLALAAGTALDALGAWLASRWREPRLGWAARALPALIAVAVAGDLYVVNRRTVDRFHGPKIATTPVAKRFHLTKKPYARWGPSLPRLNLGSAGCYEAMGFRVPSGLWTGDVAQVRVEGARGRVRAFGRTTSTAWADVEVEAPASLVWNQSWARGWTASVGTVRRDRARRLLVVDVPAGRHRVQLRYRPATFVPGVSLSLLGLAAALALAVYGRQLRDGSLSAIRRKRRAPAGRQ